MYLSFLCWHTIAGVVPSYFVALSLRRDNSGFSGLVRFFPIDVMEFCAKLVFCSRQFLSTRMGFRLIFDLVSAALKLIFGYPRGMTIE